jgi:hypothetical protein
MKAVVVLSKKETEELAELYHTAQTTPMIAFTTQAMLEGRDWASLAWDRVRKKMEELGEKYGYNPRKVQINNKTGEVFPR